MTTTSRPRYIRHVAAALTLGVLVAGIGATTATSAAANTMNVTSTHSTPDVGTPGEVNGSAAAIAPDGTRINGTTAVPFGGHRTREGATPNGPRALSALSTQGALQVDILASGARLRAWVPNGTVLGLAYPHQTAWGGCQIPGSDGWVWGWLSVKTAAGWRSGWMRHDLWSVSELTHPAGTAVAQGVNDLPWC